MKVLIVGMPYFSEKLKDQFQKHDPKNNYVFLNTFYKGIDRLKFILHILNSQILYMIGGGLNNSRSIDLALLLNKKVVIHWCGSDVLRAKEEISANTHNIKYIQHLNHLCEVEWIRKELQELGIQAKVLPRTTYEPPKNKLRVKPRKFIVLSYINKYRPDFYGIDTLINLAKDFPKIEFRLVGIEQFPGAPRNIKLLGWVDDMSKEYENCSVYIRAPKHDGIAYSVIEALAHGKIVLRNKKFPYCRYYDSYEDLKRQLHKITRSFKKGDLPIDYAAIKYISSKYKVKNVIKSLSTELSNLLEGNHEVNN